MKNEQTSKWMKRLPIELDRGRINPLEASLQINAFLGGISRAVWNPGQGQFKVFNDQKPEDYRIPVDGASVKLQETAALCYRQAQLNGSLKPGEIHISDQISTKHHASAVSGFGAYVQALLSKYAAAQSA